MNAKANDTVDKAQELYEKLYLAAKKSKTRRFHALYDKVYRTDILNNAWSRVKVNKGTAGVDNESIQDIMANDEEQVIAEIRQTLKERGYRPRNVKRVYIPRTDGRERPLGIPTVRDRIVQTATKQILEPIFEADFLDCSYGFRPNRSAHDALEEIRKTMNAGFRVVLDADIKGFFDNIDHEKLLEFVHQRISDRRILKLIRKWLKCGVMEGGVTKETIVGAPQGGVISPLLANIYLYEFDKFWKRQTVVTGKLVRYADDFIILFKTKEEAELGLQLVKAKLGDLGLELNEKKTRTVDTGGGKEGFDFLGFHHRRVKSGRYKKHYTLKWPSNKSMKNIKTSIGEFLGSRAILNQSTEDVVEVLNPMLRGWMNYFRYGNSERKFRQIDSYIREELALWWSKKHQKSGRRWSSGSTDVMYRNCDIQSLSGNVRYWSR
ncbi:MAG: group II intron reverse transcriptase/maturase [Candidatus Bathyarchaeota archaeon]|nr:group II intron reverse transcriptase/maturase [Candidatus Bathyarchaeota archaeon]